MTDKLSLDEAIEIAKQVTDWKEVIVKEERAYYVGMHKGLTVEVHLNDFWIRLDEFKIGPYSPNHTGLYGAVRHEYNKWKEIKETALKELEQQELDIMTQAARKLLATENKSL